MVPNYYSEKLVIKPSRCLTTVQCRQREIFVYFARCAAFHVHTNITFSASSGAFLVAMWTFYCLIFLRINWSLHPMLQKEFGPHVPRVGPGPKVPNETNIVLGLLKHLLRRRYYRPIFVACCMKGMTKVFIKALKEPHNRPKRSPKGPVVLKRISNKAYEFW